MTKKKGKVVKSKPVAKAKAAVKTTKSTKTVQKSRPAPVAKAKPVVHKIPKLTVPKTAFKQSEFITVLAEQSALSKNEVKSVLESLKAIAKVHLAKNGPGQFTLPGVLKITSVTKPATKARQGRNPFTGEEITIKPKPARKVIKIKALKKFKTELE